MSATATIMGTIIVPIVLAFVLEALGIRIEPKRRHWEDDQSYFWYEDHDR